ncbi:MAG TPA: type I DNA topoisomerase [Candidatus Eisenbacteria bacterium]|nr:type I DNA topoisomerase [Candidatus Eisenbacteria bacterium]
MPRTTKKKEEGAEESVAKPGKAGSGSAGKTRKGGRSLVIVESPTKAKTIAKFLGKEFTVLSSFGHVRDLPKNDIGVDVEHGFVPKYIVPVKSKKVVSELKKAAAKADMVYFASDEDREGEAISWHLLEILDLEPERVKRITFHEITEEAIKAALEHPRDLDMRLVDAQQARRVLDRLVGYELSPFLWRKVARGLSAGRVQSVIVRLIVEREREIEKFVPQEYWSIEAMLSKHAGDPTFLSRLVKKDGDTLDKFALSKAEDADKVMADLEGAKWAVESVERKTVHRSPLPPFTTSTLQQEANNRLGFSAKQTMMIAQQLYEGVDLGESGATGLITYMRTDSVNLSEKFLLEAREWLGKRAGKDALPEEPRRYKTKSKGAQEAHEAVRPTSVFRDPSEVAKHLDDRQFKLYTLIWQRAVASQMADAELMTMTINVDATGKGPRYTFRATGSTIVKKGFLEVYDTDTKETLLPDLQEKDPLVAESVTPKQHFTEPPPRYTEASLVKMLEENGIGRPSTYAPTISTVVDRGYVEKDGRKLKPTELAAHVNDLLVAHFPDIVDTGFTASMEESLDSIAEGEKEWVPVISAFYGPFKKNLTEKDKEVSKKALTETTEEVCEKCGKPMIIKFGRFGKFMACTGFPECRNTKPIPGTEPPGGTVPIDEKCATCGAPMMVKRGRFGEFLSCSRYPECKTVKPLQKKVGVKCPSCREGDIIEKKTRKGKTFYACSRYPDCTFALWSRPNGELCPKCSSLVVFAKADTVRCSNKECDFERQVEKTAT